MKFDFSEYPFFDNHTHIIHTEPIAVTPEAFAVNYYHGVKTAKDKKGQDYPSQDAVKHLKYQSVIMTLVNAMSERFGCEPTLEGAARFHAEHTSTVEDLRKYTQVLFQDQNVAGVTLDCELPIGNPKTTYFPCKVYRLFRYEDVFNEAIKEEDHYSALRERVLSAIHAARKEGFDGLKGHMGEKFGGFDVKEVSPEEAERLLPAAKRGEKAAIDDIYFALIGDVLELAGELHMPIHFHSGTTGLKKREEVYQVDPLLMVHYLKKNALRFANTRIVFIHGSFPFTRNAAWMAYNFPNVYVDLSQTGLWQGVMLEQILMEYLSVVPHDKIIFGSGQHGYCEMTWLAARSAKRALEGAMERLTDQHFLNANQAKESARMMLGENGFKVYEY